MDRSPRARALLVLAVVTALTPLTLLGDPTILRVAATIPALLVAPGLAIVGFTRLRDPLSELLLAVVGSLAGLVLVGQVELALRWWSPEVTFALVSELTAATLLRHAVHRSHEPPSDPADAAHPVGSPPAVELLEPAVDGEQARR